MVQIPSPTWIDFKKYNPSFELGKIRVVRTNLDVKYAIEMLKICPVETFFGNIWEKNNLGQSRFDVICEIAIWMWDTQWLTQPYRTSSCLMASFLECNEEFIFLKSHIKVKS